VSAQPLDVDGQYAPPPQRRRLAAAVRRATILEAAIPVFATLGYEQTRMSDVATQVGITEPVIFQNFGTKAKLFAAALERVSEQASDYLNDMAGKNTSVDRWLCQLLASDHLDHLHTAPMFGVLFACTSTRTSVRRCGGALHASPMPWRAC
jgi:AcrR family transcriptional regulator